MPNEPLATKLTQLMDGFGLRQKRANALLAAFKLVTDAHAKTLRVLRDYADQDTTVDVRRAQEGFAEVRIRKRPLTRCCPNCAGRSKPSRP